MCLGRRGESKQKEAATTAEGTMETAKTEVGRRGTGEEDRAKGGYAAACAAVAAAVGVTGAPSNPSPTPSRPNLG